MKRKLLITASVLVTGITILRAQSNIGSTAAPDASAMLQVSSTTKGFRPPQVSLTATTSFGLTAPTIAANANGMMVYNNNASITGTAAYPAYGAGIYSWDGSGWVAPGYTCPAVLVASGTTTGPVSNNSLTVLDLSNVSVNKSDVTVTGSNTVNIVTAGTYKIDVCEEALLLSNSATNNASLACYLARNGANIESGFISQLPVTGSSNLGLPYKITFSAIAVFAAGDNLQVKGLSYGMPVNCTFQVKELKIRRLQ